MVRVFFHPSILEKIAKRGISVNDVQECFINRWGGSLVDGLEEHKTVPPTLWFLARTDAGKLLKIIYIFDADANEIDVKSAYEPNFAVITLYARNYPEN